MFKALNRVFTRILALSLLAFAALALFGAFVIYASRENLYEQKRADIQHVVQGAVSIVAGLDKRVAAGELTRDQAQAEAKRIIGTVRYGNGDYVFIYDSKGTLLLNPTRMQDNGQNRWNTQDTRGKYFVREFIENAKAGGGFTVSVYVKPGTNDIGHRFTYSTHFAAWDWVIATGVMIEDIEAIHATILRDMIVALGLFAVLLIAGTLVITRSIVGPLGRLTNSLKLLAGGDIDADVKGAQRGDEFGSIARAIVDVREAVRRRTEAQLHQQEDARIAAERERVSQEDLARVAEEQAKAERERERRTLLGELARSLDAQVKAVAEKVETSARDLVTTAQAMQKTSAAARQDAGEASGVSRVASEHVSTVGEAAGQLDGAINEIGERVNESAKIAHEAVDKTREADRIVRTLSDASAEIGKVVSLIQAIAEQTNLLALNATIEAARAGESGKGFAVVAAEVKTLANQTAKATEEIASRITAVVEATGRAVDAIQAVDLTIARISEISGTIAASVQEQGAATSEIARAVGQASNDTASLANSMGRLVQAADDTTSSSQQVLASASGLSQQTAALTQQVQEFVARIAAA